MKRIIFIGRVAAGKTTLVQALRGEQLNYCKTQSISYTDSIIDTPGEYCETKGLGAALAIYAYEAEVCALVISATEQYCPFSPNITCMVNRDVVGIITGIDKAFSNVERAESWLKLCGCEKIFKVSSYTKDGLDDIIKYLDE